MKKSVKEVVRVTTILLVVAFLIMTLFIGMY